VEKVAIEDISVVKKFPESKKFPKWRGGGRFARTRAKKIF